MFLVRKAMSRDLEVLVRHRRGTDTHGLHSMQAERVEGCTGSLASVELGK